MKVLRPYGLILRSRKTFLKKKQVHNSVHVTSSHISQREIRMSHDTDFTFSQFFADSKPFNVWDIPENFKEFHPKAVYQNTDIKSVSNWHECWNASENTLLFSAIMSFRTHSNIHLACMWYVITNLFDIRLCGLSENDLFLVLLGHHIIYETNNKSFSFA